MPKILSGFILPDIVNSAILCYNKIKFHIKEAVFVNDLFPEMLDRPDNGRVIAGIIYWPVCYMLIPFVTTLLVLGPNTHLGIFTIVDFFYYLFNGLFMFGLFLPYIKDCLLTVQVDSRRFWKYSAIAAGIMAFLALGTIAMGFRTGFGQLISLFPITETSVLTYPGLLVMDRPILGTLCSVLVNPFTVSCMFYATIFAPVSGNHPKLAYLAVSLGLLVPRLFNIWWLGYPFDEMLTYFVQLPFHLLACWAYQKTETILAPAAALGVLNLISGGFLLLLQATGMIWIQ